MKIIYTKSFDNTLKKLKSHHKEYNNLLRITDIINDTPKFDMLIKLPSITALYNLERLRYNNEYYSLNLSKNGGVIRLIVKQRNDDIEFVFISYKHYEDFNKERVIYYDK